MGEPTESLEIRGAELPQAPARRLRLTLAGSLLLHSLLLIWLAAAGTPYSSPGTPAILRVRIEGSAAQEPAPEPAEPLAADLPHEFSSLTPSAASAIAAARPSAARGDAESAAESEIAVESFELAAPALVATPMDSGPAMAQAAEAATARVTRGMTESERDTVLERVQAWIHELEASDPRRAQLSWQQDGVPYTAVLKRRAPAGATGFERLEVEIETPGANGPWKAGLSLRRVAFSQYSQFVDRWDPEVQLHDDVIVGRFHANSPIIIGYDRDAAPRFLGRVTTAGHGYRVADGFGRLRRDEVFPGGIETRVGHILMPTKLEPLFAGVDGGAAGLRTFDRDTRIRFRAEGGYEWCPIEAQSACQLEPPAAGIGYLVGAPGVELRVSGIVRGQLLVQAPGHIVIEGDLRYARDPRTEPDADDLLGLVAGRDVVIARPKLTGRGDLEIHAAIYARRRFLVTDEEARRAGTLRILGSLTAGSLTATEPRYATRIDFDPRLETRRPPGFPMTSRYEFEAAPAEWVLAEPPELR